MTRMHRMMVASVCCLTVICCTGSERDGEDAAAPGSRGPEGLDAGADASEARAPTNLDAGASPRFDARQVDVSDAHVVDSPESGRALVDAGPDAGPMSARRRLAIVAGTIYDHGAGTHEYERTATLLKHLFDSNPEIGLDVEVHYRGDMASISDSVDAIAVISDGADRGPERHPFYVGDGLGLVRRRAEEGVGIANLHWTVFHPSEFESDLFFLLGGYFDYENPPAGQTWYSTITNWNGPIAFGSADHPILNGLEPFPLVDEVYFDIKFPQVDDGRTSLLRLDGQTGRVDNTIAWAVERPSHRGFASTAGHDFGNWWLDPFRTFTVNGLAWTAGLAVPAEGHVTSLEPAVRVLLVTGYDHPAHAWTATTAKLFATLQGDPRINVHVVETPEALASEDLTQFASIVLHYNNWDQPGLSQAAQDALVAALERGVGLSVLHFANGAFNFSLPSNGGTDWPLYRERVVARTWTHDISGHDAYQGFEVRIDDQAHPVTAGLSSFTTEDELYYQLEGDLPAQVLATGFCQATQRQEPLAWVYEAFGARAFQTVLGHSPEAIVAASPLIRRGVAWASGLAPLSFDPPRVLVSDYLFKPGSQWLPP